MHKFFKKHLINIIAVFIAIILLLVIIFTNTNSFLLPSLFALFLCFSLAFQYKNVFTLFNKYKFIIKILLLIISVSLLIMVMLTNGINGLFYFILSIYFLLFYFMYIIMNLVLYLIYNFGNINLLNEIKENKKHIIVPLLIFVIEIVVFIII